MAKREETAADRRYRMPERLKEERLQRVRSKLIAATPRTKRTEIKPVQAFVFWLAVLAAAVWYFKDYPLT